MSNFVVGDTVVALVDVPSSVAFVKAGDFGTICNVGKVTKVIWNSHPQTGAWYVSKNEIDIVEDEPVSCTEKELMEFLGVKI